MGKQASAEKVTFGDPTALGSVSNVLTLDFAVLTKQKVRVTLTENVTSVVINNPLGAGNFQVEIVQGGAGAFTIAGWPARVMWLNGTAPTFADATGDVRLVGFYFNGPTQDDWFGEFNADTYS